MRTLLILMALQAADVITAPWWVFGVVAIVDLVATITLSGARRKMVVDAVNEGLTARLGRPRTGEGRKGVG